MERLQEAIGPGRQQQTKTADKAAVAVTWNPRWQSGDTARVGRYNSTADLCNPGSLTIQQGAEVDGSPLLGRQAGGDDYFGMTDTEIIKISWVPVAHTCNPSYSGGRDQQDPSLKPTQVNSS
jgi:hypothetical protein